MSKSTTVYYTFFALARAISEVGQFIKMCLPKVGQSHVVQFSQLHHSIANVKIYKCLSHILALALTVSEISQLKMCTSKK